MRWGRDPHGPLQSEVNRTFARAGITGEAAAVLMIVFGVLIIIFPLLVAWLIGLYLVIVGILQLMGHLDARSRTRYAPPPPSAPPTMPPIP